MLCSHSLLTLHPLLSGQAAQAPPPQSTSVSVPSVLLSSHLVATHRPVPSLHSMLRQSLSPPQSESVSVPSCISSWHSGESVPARSSPTAMSWLGVWPTFQQVFELVSQ